MLANDDFPLNGLAEDVRTRHSQEYVSAEQRECVCIGLKNTSTYVPILYTESPTTSLQLGFTETFEHIDPLLTLYIVLLCVSRCADEGLGTQKSSTRLLC